MKLYQDCSWPVRLWRRRHYLPIPFLVLKTWYQSDDEDIDLDFLFKIHVGLAQCKMNWVYTQEEVMGSLKERLTKMRSEKTNSLAK